MRRKKASRIVASLCGHVSSVRTAAAAWRPAALRRQVTPAHAVQGSSPHHVCACRSARCSFPPTAAIAAGSLLQFAHTARRAVHSAACKQRLPAVASSTRLLLQKSGKGQARKLLRQTRPCRQHTSEMDTSTSAPVRRIACEEGRDEGGNGEGRRRGRRPGVHAATRRARAPLLPRSVVSNAAAGARLTAARCAARASAQRRGASCVHATYQRAVLA